jgi:hypothetical protein
MADYNKEVGKLEVCIFAFACSWQKNLDAHPLNIL